MSLLTVSARATALKLLLDTTQCGSQVGCEQFKVRAVQLADDAEHADPPFLKRLVKPPREIFNHAVLALLHNQPAAYHAGIESVLRSATRPSPEDMTSGVGPGT